MWSPYLMWWCVVAVLWMIFVHFVEDLSILANQRIFKCDFDPRRDIQNITIDCIRNWAMNGYTKPPVDGKYYIWGDTRYEEFNFDS